MSGSEGTDDPRFVYALFAMLAGPSVTGLLLTMILEGKNGIRQLLSRVVRWQVAPKWYAVALLAAPLFCLATLLLLSRTASRFLPALLTVNDAGTLVVSGLAAALAAGVFEEIGWTGFAVRQIRRRHGIFATGLMVGVLWGAWHLPVNVLWAGPATAGDMALEVFLPVSALMLLFGSLAAFRILMVWVYEHTGSVCVAMIMHLSLTASVLILDPQGLSGGAMLTYSLALAAALWATVAVVVVRNRWRPAQWPPRRFERAA
jgi:membrane protease YdiL (CAAX protease family)